MTLLEKYALIALVLFSGIYFVTWLFRTFHPASYVSGIIAGVLIRELGKEW